MTTTTLPLDGERLLQIARDTGLRHHLHAVSPTEARALLTTFVAAVIGGNAQPVGRAHDDGKVTWYAPIPEGGAFVYAGPVPAAAVAEETSPRKLALDILMQVADEAPINGNELAQARVLMAASRLRAEAPQVSGNPGQVADAQPVELQGVSEAIREGDGFWKTCSGCHESNEGVPTGPYSRALECHLGNGCGECGGIGAVWDTTDYQAMADQMALSMNASQPSAQAQPVSRVDGLHAIRGDLTADLREVFDASGPETQQTVRDVIEYVDSWLSVFAQRQNLTASAPAQAQPSGNAGELEADMFWDVSDPERYGGENLHDAVSYAGDNFTPNEVPFDLTFQAAKRLPDVRVRVTDYSDDSGWKYEVIAASKAGAKS